MLLPSVQCASTETVELTLGSRRQGRIGIVAIPASSFSKGELDVLHKVQHAGKLRGALAPDRRCRIAFAEAEEYIECLAYLPKTVSVI